MLNQRNRVLATLNAQNHKIIYAKPCSCGGCESFYTQYFEKNPTVTKIQEFTDPCWFSVEFNSDNNIVYVNILATLPTTI